MPGLIGDPRFLRTVGVAGVCTAIAGYGLLTAWLVPLTLRVAYDPSIQYMLTSLAWFRGNAYTYIDHPGTPVEILGTALLLLSHPFVMHASELIDFQLSQPQYFLSVAQSAVVVCSLAVCALLGWRAVEVTHWSLALVAVAIAGLFFVVHPMAFESLARWSHESFNFPAGTGFLLGTLVLVRRPTRLPWPWVFVVGFAAGILTSIQLYFAAWVIGAAIALSIASRLQAVAWQYAILRGVSVIAAAGVGFVVSTLPIHDRYGDFFTWVWTLTSHEQTYGQGAEGFSTPALMLSNALAEFSQAPELCVGVLVVGGVLVWRLVVDARGTRHDIALWSIGLGLAAQSVVIVVLAAKHPGVKYLLPLAATLPVLLAAALGRTIVTRRSAIVAASVGLLGSAALVASLALAVSTHLALRDSLIRGDQATEAILLHTAAAHGIPRLTLRTLWAYGTTSPCYALWFGDETTGGAFKPDIGQRCPRDLNLSVFSGRVLGPGLDTPIHELRSWDVALIPADIVMTRPDALPAGAATPTHIPSVAFGTLVAFVNPDALASDP